MALVGITKFSQLGSCWSPDRVFGNCHLCSRYDTCNYPDRVTNVSYDALVDKRDEAFVRFKALSKEVQNVGVRQ